MERKPGYYKVQYGPEWIVAEWDTQIWKVTFTSIPFHDWMFEKIGNKIEF